MPSVSCSRLPSALGRRTDVLTRFEPAVASHARGRIHNNDFEEQGGGGDCGERRNSGWRGADPGGGDFRCPSDDGQVDEIDREGRFADCAPACSGAAWD